jgi:hypothetical protein
MSSSRTDRVLLFQPPLAPATRSSSPSSPSPLKSPSSSKTCTTSTLRLKSQSRFSAHSALGRRLIRLSSASPRSRCPTERLLRRSSSPLVEGETLSARRSRVKRERRLGLLEYSGRGRTAILRRSLDWSECRFVRFLSSSPSSPSSFHLLFRRLCAAY